MADAPVTSVVRRINELPSETSPTATDVVAIDGFATRKATLSAIVNAGRPFATDAEADSGNSATKGMSPSLVARTIEAKRPAGVFGLKLLLGASASAVRTLLELGGLATKATVNNGDWSGADLSLANGGTGASTAPAARDALGLGSAATTEASAYATAAQGGKADTAVQPGALASVATSGAYGDLGGKPTLGTAAAQAASAFATATQGTKADNAAPIARAVPLGGATGQVLAKSSAADNALVWKDVAPGADLATVTFSTAGTARASFSGWDAFNSRGLVLEGQTGTGINTKSAGTSYNLIRITDDSINQSDSPFGGSKVEGFTVLQYMNVTGGAKGGRHAIIGSLFHVNTPGFQPAQGAGFLDDNYVGVVGSITANVNDGGTASRAKGAIFGGHFITSLGNDATYYNNATALELNTVLGSAPVRIHQLLQMAGGSNVKGSEIDAIIGISGLAEATVHFRHAIYVGGQNGRHPLGPTSTFLKVDATTIDTLLDLTSVGMTGDLVRTPYIVINENIAQFKKGNARLRLGSPGVTNTPTLELFSGAGASANSRIYGIGGAGADTGDIGFAASSLRTPNIVPLADNASLSGSPSFRWSAVYSATGVITTSDEREKTDVADLTAEAALALFSAVDAKTYRKVDDHAERRVETVTTLRPKTERRSHVDWVEEIEMADGQALLRRAEKEIFYDEPVYDEHPVIDPSTGLQIIDVVEARNIKQVDPETGEEHTVFRPESRSPRVHRVPVMEEYTEEVVVSEEHYKANSRTHFGFLAQDFERALGAAGLTTKDFAGVVIGEDGRYGLRYEQTIPILWSVVKSLAARLDALEG